VVADRHAVVVKRVVGLHDVGAFGEVGLERALKHVAAVDQHHAAIGRTGRPEVGHVSGEDRQAFDRAVQIVGPHDRDRHRLVLRWLSLAHGVPFSIPSAGRPAREQEACRQTEHTQRSEPFSSRADSTPDLGGSSSTTMRPATLRRQHRHLRKFSAWTMS